MKGKWTFKNYLIEADDLNSDAPGALPEGTMKELQKLMRKGAEDANEQWSSALHLVHKAYQSGNVQRPTPEMEDAWKQYEDNIKFATEQLSKYRGINGAWRMSGTEID